MSYRSQLRPKLVLPEQKKPANSPAKKLDVSKLRNIEEQDRLTSVPTDALDANVVDSADVDELWKRLKQTAFSTAENRSPEKKIIRLVSRKREGYPVATCGKAESV